MTSEVDYGRPLRASVSIINYRLVPSLIVISMVAIDRFKTRIAYYDELYVPLISICNCPVGAIWYVHVKGIAHEHTKSNDMIVLEGVGFNGSICYFSPGLGGILRSLVI